MLTETIKICVLTSLSSTVLKQGFGKRELTRCGTEVSSLKFEAQRRLKKRRVTEVWQLTVYAVEKSINMPQPLILMR